MTTTPWFKAKQYGWGWTPATWQGWAILVLYVLLIIHDFRRLDRLSHSVSDLLINFVPNTVILTLALIGICYLTGEPPKWQWGNKK